MAERKRTIQQQNRVGRDRLLPQDETFSPERDSEFAGEFAINSRYVRRNLNGRNPKDEAERIADWKTTF